MSSKSGETVMYSQLQPWSTSGALPCMEPVTGPMVPPRVGLSYSRPRPHPWRPTMAFENSEVNNLVEIPITNQMMQPCFSPPGMKTEPLTFPNLVTGFERNPQHAARAALYTRYTASEWANNNLAKYAESNLNRNASERLRHEAVRLMREADEKTATGQRDVGRRLGERITDVTFWRNELNTELDKLVSESSAFSELKRKCGEAILSLEPPLHIAQECLYHREARAGVEKVHDAVERGLLMEIDNLRNSRAKLGDLNDRITKQANACRAAQNQLEEDIAFKESTLGIDNVCHQLNNYSRGINYYGGIEKYDPTISTQESWAEGSAQRVSRSQSERAKVSQLRTDIETLVNSIAQTIWDYWVNTNNSFDRRAQEMNDSKNRLQLHLQKIQQEIFDLEKHIFLLQKAIQDKSNPMKVAQTRLEARSHREGFELCKDIPQLALIEEVGDIKSYVHKLHKMLEEAEAQHQTLLKTRSALEVDLKNKVNAIFIDREKCMSLRRSFPISRTIQY